MTIFDELERHLVASVRAGAIDPAEKPATPRDTRWRRTPLIACIAGLVVTGAALAATGVLPIGTPPDEPPVSPGESPGLVEGPALILALRVADPTGGPPWALRIFRTDRDASCLQVGRFYRGRFGMVTADAAGTETFRPLKALPGSNSLCSGVERNGIPVLRGLRKVILVGGTSDPRRCNGRPCPITDVRVIRYGTLGPAARSATFIDAAGKPAASIKLNPKDGGAYLFVTAVPAGPYQRGDEQQQQFAAAVNSAQQAARAKGLSQKETSRQVAKVINQMSRQPAARVSLRTRDAVNATFADGSRVRVAGPGRTAGPLPGIKPRTQPLPDVASPLRVTTHGTRVRRQFVVSFRAPVAIRRFDRHYTLTLHGPTGPTCTRNAQDGYNATTHRIAKGTRVRFRVTPNSAGYSRTTWCPGTFTIKVAYQTGPRDGAKVGTFRFTVPPK